MIVPFLVLSYCFKKVTYQITRSGENFKNGFCSSQKTLTLKNGIYFSSVGLMLMALYLKQFLGSTDEIYQFILSLVVIFLVIFMALCQALLET